MKEPEELEERTSIEYKVGYLYRTQNKDKKDITYFNVVADFENVSDEYAKELQEKYDVDRTFPLAVHHLTSGCTAYRRFSRSENWVSEEIGKSVNHPEYFI